MAMRTYENLSSREMYLVTVLLGVIGGVALAVILGSNHWSEFLSKAGLGFGVAWGLAYMTIKG